MKLKGKIILVVAMVVAIILGFFVYKKVEDNKEKYVEVKFIDDYNHETLSTQTLEVGKDAEVPNEPKHEGCKFSGWYNSSNEKIESFKNIQEDLTVYAKCSILSYKVKFIDGISKKVIDTQTIKYGEDAVAPVIPKHYGYNFIRWKGNYRDVKSNLVVKAIYSAQSAKYVVKYFTVDDDVTKLYATKTYNSYVNRKVKASIISIGGYQYDKDNSSNKLSGRVSADNSLVLKVYYDSSTYSIIINGEETEYNYKDEIKLPVLEKTVTLSYVENDAVTNKQQPNVIDLNFLGYCKNNKTCDDPIPGDTMITVTESAEYYPVWEMDMVLNLPAGEGYEIDGATYSFEHWEGSEGDYNANDSIKFTDDLELTATYTKDGEHAGEDAEYTINIYRDDKLYSSTSEPSKVGKQIFGSKYAVEVEGYVINSYTDSIFISENPDDNVIEVYYITEGEEDPIITDPTDEPGNESGEDTPPADEPGNGDDGNGSDTPPAEEPGNGDEGNGSDTPPADEPGNGSDTPPADEPGNGDDGNGSDTPPAEEPGNGDDGNGSDTPPAEEPGNGDDGNGSDTPPADEPGNGNGGNGNDAPPTGGTTSGGDTSNPPSNNTTPSDTNTQTNDNVVDNSNNNTEEGM